MTVLSQFKKDLKAARKLWLPWWALVALAPIGLGVIALCDYFGKLNSALPILACATVLVLALYIKWEFRRELPFQLTFLAIVLLHGALIWIIPWTNKWVPSLAIAFISSWDFCGVLWILELVGSSRRQP